jgi:hypothetical protein
VHLMAINFRFLATLGNLECLNGRQIDAKANNTSELRSSFHAQNWPLDCNIEHGKPKVCLAV